MELGAAQRSLVGYGMPRVDGLHHRTRQQRADQEPTLPIKEVLGYPLRKDFRQRLAEVANG